MNDLKENYLFHIQSIKHLNEAWRLLREIRSSSDRDHIVGSAFKYALIEYCKPFTRTVGILKKDYRLDDLLISKEYLDLHNKIYETRSQILAHGDLSILEAEVFVTKNSKGEKLAGSIQNVVYGTELFEKIDEIILLIESTLKKLYQKRDDLEKCLPFDKKN